MKALNPVMGRRMKKNGFSLIEVMVVVALIGVLAAIALPSYTSYITRSARTECRSALMQVMQQQERYYTQQNVYLAFASTDNNVPMRQFSGDSRTASACTIGASACAGANLGNCVVVTGTPVKADPEVGNITLQSDGTKGCSVSGSTKCWVN